MIQVIPAIDIIDGKCVRLTKGDFAAKKIYNHDPLESAQQFEGIGLKRLHLVDLDGAKQGRVVNHKVLERIANKTGLSIDFGGGIKSDQDLRIALECGAKQITAGSVAVKDPDLCLRWFKEYGPEVIILGADVKKEKIAIHGWQEESQVWLMDHLAKYEEQGARYVICTDVECDGMLSGPNFDLYKKIRDHFPKMQLIASGGVSSLKDLERLNQDQLYAVIVGKALYEGRITLSELKIFCQL